jgi:hypothetical protein
MEIELPVVQKGIRYGCVPLVIGTLYEFCPEGNSAAVSKLLGPSDLLSEVCS